MVRVRGLGRVDGTRRKGGARLSQKFLWNGIEATAWGCYGVYFESVVGLAGKSSYGRFGSVLKGWYFSHCMIPEYLPDPVSKYKEHGPTRFRSSS